MNIALILLAGKGKRLGLDRPKQFKEIGGKPLFLYSLETFLKHPSIDRIILVTDNEHIDYVKEIVKEKYNQNIETILGGETRQLSVYSALKYLYENKVKDDDNILIHDSARPLVSEKVISRCLDGLDDYLAVVPSIKIDDTVINIEEDIVISTIDRETLLLNQTPQCFKFHIIFKAHNKAIENQMYDKTDDVTLVLKINEKIHYVLGDKLNFKITNSDDLALFECIIKSTH